MGLGDGAAGVDLVAGIILAAIGKMMNLRSSLTAADAWSPDYLVEGGVHRSQLRQPPVRHVTHRIGGREDSDGLERQSHQRWSEISHRCLTKDLNATHCSLSLQCVCVCASVFSQP